MRKTDYKRLRRLRKGALPRIHNISLLATILLLVGFSPREKVWVRNSPFQIPYNPSLLMNRKKAPDSGLFFIT